MSDFITACELLSERGGYIHRPHHWYMFGADNERYEYGFAEGPRGLSCYLVRDGLTHQHIPSDGLFNAFHIRIKDYDKDDWEHVAP